MSAIRTILLAEDSPADAEMAIDALRDANLANPMPAAKMACPPSCCWTSRCRAWTGWRC